MAASVVVTPSEVQVGDTVTITGSGFLPNTQCDVSIPEHGVDLQVTSDPDGSVNNADLADFAVGTITSDGTNVTAADTVTVGSVTYTFRASVSTTANEVLIGADAATTLANLKHAINLDGTAGVYGSATVINPDCTAGALTSTTLQVYAKTRGTGGNAKSLAKSSTHLSVSGANLSGGAAAGTKNPILFTPQVMKNFTVKISDGTSTAQTTVQVWSE